MRFRTYFAELLLECEMFQTKVVEKIKPHILFTQFIHQQMHIY
jgi:hypothetical protein